MRVFEYKCSECEAVVESPDPKAQLKHCGTVMLRVYGFGGVSFKGPGFYKTDK